MNVSFFLEGEGDLELSELLEDPEFDLDLAVRRRGLRSGDLPALFLMGLRLRGDTLRRRGDGRRLGDGERRRYRLGDLRLSRDRLCDLRLGEDL